MRHSYVIFAITASAFLSVVGCSVEPDVEQTDFGPAPLPFTPPVPPDCITDDPCVVSAMNAEGLCDIIQIPGCALCTNKVGVPGTSRDGGECCVSCWAGSTCYPDPDGQACGLDGALCLPCLGGERCVDGTCGWP